MVRRFRVWWYWKIQPWRNYLTNRRRYIWAWQSMNTWLSLSPYIVTGETRGLYIVEQEDCYCRWCGNSEPEGHNAGCSYVVNMQHLGRENEIIGEWGQT